jgi:hypothetical protein
MKEIPTIKRLAGELELRMHDYFTDVLGLISRACNLCRDRPDMRGDAAAVIEEYLSWQVDDYNSSMLCSECGEGFQPASWKQLRHSSRRYVDFYLENGTDSGRLFHLCRACGGQLPFDETSGVSEGETR